MLLLNYHKKIAPLEYKSYVDQWVPTQGFTDLEIAQKIRELEIDILVDVAGHTKGGIVWGYLLINLHLFLYLG